jgi:outer membrane receptor protein involved in Fe transport
MDAHVQAAGNYMGSRNSDLRTAELALKGKLKSYTTVDLSFGVEKNDWTLELFATNLFDSRGIVDTGVQCLETICGTGVTATTPTGGVFYDSVIRPRLIGLKVGTKF